MIQLAALPVEDALDESVVEAHNSFYCKNILYQNHLLLLIILPECRNLGGLFELLVGSWQFVGDSHLGAGSCNIANDIHNYARSAMGVRSSS